LGAGLQAAHQDRRHGQSAPCRLEELVRRGGIQPDPALAHDLAHLSNHCDSGLIILPRSLLDTLPAVWARWVGWTWRQGRLLGRFRIHCFQISLALALMELGIDVDHLPLGLHFPTDVKTPHPAARDVSPSVVHYYGNLDRLGNLGPTGLPQVDAALRQIND
jgi:hypothetical protein